FLLCCRGSVGVVGLQLQAAGLDIGHAFDVTGDPDRIVDLLLVIHIAAQVHDAVDGFHVHVHAGDVGVGQQAGLDLGGDPGVIDRLVGIAVENAVVDITIFHDVDAVAGVVAIGHGAVAVRAVGLAAHGAAARGVHGVLALVGALLGGGVAVLGGVLGHHAAGAEHQGGRQRAGQDGSRMVLDVLVHGLPRSVGDVGPESGQVPVQEA